MGSTMYIFNGSTNTTYLNLRVVAQITIECEEIQND